MELTAVKMGAKVNLTVWCCLFSVAKTIHNIIRLQCEFFIVKGMQNISPFFTLNWC